MGKNMKKIFFATCALFSLSVSAISAQCCEPFLGCGDWYIGGFGGANWVNYNGSHHGSHHKYKVGYVAGGEIGYRWENGFRVEGEVSYRQNDHKRHHNSGQSGSHHAKKTTAYMANGIYQFELDCLFGFDIFGGAGLGYANTQHNHHDRTENRNRHRKHNGFAWQLIAGVAYPICENFDIDLEYRFFDETNSKFYNSSVDVGLKYYF